MCSINETAGKRVLEANQWQAEERAFNEGTSSTLPGTAAPQSQTRTATPQPVQQEQQTYSAPVLPTEGGTPAVVLTDPETGAQFIAPPPSVTEVVREVMEKRLPQSQTRTHSTPQPQMRTPAPVPVTQQAPSASVARPAKGTAKPNDYGDDAGRMASKAPAAKHWKSSDATANEVVSSVLNSKGGDDVPEQFRGMERISATEYRDRNGYTRFDRDYYARKAAAAKPQRPVKAETIEVEDFSGLEKIGEGVYRDADGEVYFSKDFGVQPKKPRSASVEMEPLLSPYETTGQPPVAAPAVKVRTYGTGVELVSPEESWTRPEDRPKVKKVRVETEEIRSPEDLTPMGERNRRIKRTQVIR